MVRLLNDEVRDVLPPLYSKKDRGMDALAKVKFFTPDACWSWYAVEFDGEDVFFGLVVRRFTELGYFSLSELKDFRGTPGLPVERDRYFFSRPLRDPDGLITHPRRSASGGRGWCGPAVLK